MILFFKTQNHCQGSQYCNKQIPASNIVITRSFSSIPDAGNFFHHAQSIPPHLGQMVSQVG